MKKKLKIIGWVFLLALVGIQFLQIDKSNPEVDHTNDIFQQFTADETIITKVKDACYDCHSNYTEYPWYTYVQPVGWWVKGHINHGKDELNFSEFGTYNDKRAHHKLEECVELIENNSMPLSSFTWTHKEARLSDLEKRALIDWFKGQMNNIGG